jgi:mRNA-degrading endonuclease RelE of RelBE toxin-antitoxin system
MRIQYEKKFLKDIQKLIRIGDYRLGFSCDGQDVVIIRLLHRKDTYKFFP